MVENVRNIFFNNGFMPHVHCYLSYPPLVWTMLLTDSLIGIAYMAISMCLYALVRKIRLPFTAMFLAFGLFIGACGVTHFMEVYTLWIPAYWVSALVKTVTAVASVATSIYLIRLRPDIIKFCFAAREAEQHREELKKQTIELAQTNEKLKRSEETFRHLVNSVQEYAIFGLDPEGNVISWNPGAERIKLYKASEIIGEHFSKFYPLEDLSGGKPAYELEEAKIKGKFEDEGWRVRKDGSQFWANVVIAPIWDDEHRLKGFSKVTRDMSEKKRAEDQLKRSYDHLEARVEERTIELRETTDRLKLALEAAHMGTWDWNLVTGELIWSEALKGLFGYQSLEVPDGVDAFNQSIHEADKERVDLIVEKSLRGHRDFNAEYRVAWPDGSVHWISAKGKTIYGLDGRAVRMIGTAINIDDLRRSQEDLERLVHVRTEELSRAQAVLIQTAKMSALGEMAGGIAHEINTPLAAITMKAQQLERRSLQMDTMPQATVQKESHLISETAKRIGVIINGLRTFAREGTNDPFTAIPANQIVENVLALCQARFKKYEIPILYTPPSSDLNLACRLVPIEQVLLNLLSNSFDAVQELTEKWVEIHVLDKGLDVEFRVTDSGVGIPSTVLAKIMQPFFTTKGIGKGTGLGLSISKGIIESHHGSLVIDSACPHTCFVVRLPKMQPDSLAKDQGLDQPPPF